MSPYMCVYCTHDGERQVTWPTHLRYKASFHVLHFNTLVPAPEVSFADTRNNPLRKLTTLCTIALEQKRDRWYSTSIRQLRSRAVGWVTGLAFPVTYSPSVPRKFSKSISFKNLFPSEKIANLKLTTLFPLFTGYV